MNFTRENCERLFSGNSVIQQILKNAPDHRTAKNRLSTYLYDMANMLHIDLMAPKSLEWSLQISCTYALRTIISLRSEHLTGYSIMEALWRLAREEYDSVPDDLSDAFLDDLYHIFIGTTGNSRVYDREIYSVSADRHGREAAIERSEQLDAMAARVAGFMKRYPSGLDDEIRALRAENRARIMRRYGATDAEWNDHRWQLDHIVRTADELGALVTLTDEERSSIERAKVGGLPFGITPYYASLMDDEPHRRRDHAVRAQVIPPADYVASMLRHREDRSHSLDFMMEHDTSPIDLVTRRYPSIVILKPYNTCSQICVYCQRNWEIEDAFCDNARASDEALEAALGWIADHPAVSEVLVTGGDPLIMEDGQIDALMARLADIGHVERIRIGTRTPAVLPQRITSALADSIARYHRPGRREVAIVTHFEHPYEITDEAMGAVQRFKRRGMSVYNQTVFTVENSRRFEIVALRRLLRLIGVDPYYTFNTKGKEETRKYRVPMARLQQEVKEEARLAPGLARTDEPVYNVPRLGKNYIRAEQNHTLLTILPNGSRVYEFHPWEKKLALVDTYIDVDVPIYDYLKELERRGEDIEEYRSIYYYF
ncbi:MAG TPA: KamA family radical SAM protein [Spirochaetota bacterium]|nr:KamA family radical SAM protein [Spirochaetota bacterium]